MTVAFLRSNVKSMKHKLLKLSGSFTVGRAKVQEVSLCLLDVNISRKHCEFRFNPIEKNWTVTDSSSNGVTVNGKRCQKSVEFSLADGDQIILAEQKHLYSWTFQVPLTPLSMAATRTRNVEVMDEDEQEVAEGEKQEEAGAGAEEAQEDEDRANLDKVVANHSSEDNKSFIELQVENEKNGAKNAWMFKDEAMYLEMKAQQMALPSMEQQAALPYKLGNVDTWTYQNINSVFHNPDGLELTEVEKIENAKNEKKEVEQREGAAGKDLVKPETPSVKNPPDIHSKVYQRIKMIEAQHLAASRARMYARIEAAAEKRRESIAKATMSAPTDAAAVEQKRKEYVKSVLIERKKAAWARASVLRKSQTKKLNI